jgi:hypothetical protein
MSVFCEPPLTSADTRSSDYVHPDNRRRQEEFRQGRFRKAQGNAATTNTVQGRGCGRALPHDELPLLHSITSSARASVTQRHRGDGVHGGAERGEQLDHPRHPDIGAKAWELRRVVVQETTARPTAMSGRYVNAERDEQTVFPV